MRARAWAALQGCCGRRGAAATQPLVLGLVLEHTHTPAPTPSILITVGTHARAARSPSLHIARRSTLSGGSWGSSGDLQPGRCCARGLGGCSCHGSSDMELVKALREFVGMRTVSIDRKLRDECYRWAGRAQAGAACACAPVRRLAAWAPNAPRLHPHRPRPRPRLASPRLASPRLASLLHSTAPPTHHTRPPARRGAKFLLRLLESLGADVKMARASEDQNPLVLARLGHDSSRPTVTFYGHYDVQPAAEPEWRTNPFELVAVDGHLYGRCASRGTLARLAKARRAPWGAGRAVHCGLATGPLADPHLAHSTHHL